MSSINNDVILFVLYMVTFSLFSLSFVLPTSKVEADEDRTGTKEVPWRKPTDVTGNNTILTVSKMIADCMHVFNGA